MAVSQSIPQGLKWCSKCKRLLPVGDFLLRKDRGATRPASWCRSCLRERQREKRRTQPAKMKEIQRRADLKRLYGMSWSLYAAMLAAQGGACALCGRKENKKHNGDTVSSLSVDHDHGTGRVRGLLCHDCNTGIGKLQDNPELLRRAADYLERHQRP